MFTIEVNARPQRLVGEKNSTPSTTQTTVIRHKSERKATLHSHKSNRSLYQGPGDGGDGPVDRGKEFERFGDRCSHIQRCSQNGTENCYSPVVWR